MIQMVKSRSSEMFWTYTLYPNIEPTPKKAIARYGEGALIYFCL